RPPPARRPRRAGAPAQAALRARRRAAGRAPDPARLLPPLAAEHVHRAPDRGHDGGGVRAREGAVGAVSRTVLVTGATDGLGRAVAADLVRAGHTGLVHARDTQPVPPP